MSNEKMTTLYSHRLVTAIAEIRKRPLHPSVQEAFLQVPRHFFVDAYYQGDEHVSAPITHDEESWHHWLAQIYRVENRSTSDFIHRCLVNWPSFLFLCLCNLIFLLKIVRG